MEFVLNEYHRNSTDEELIDDVIKVAKMLNKNSLSKTEYNRFGKYHSSTVEHRFGGWNKALDIANLEHAKDFIIRPANVNVSDEQLLEDLKKQALILGKQSITSSEYNKYGLHGANIIKSRFSTWENALLKAGLEPTGFHRNIPEKDLFEELERVWIALGRQPTVSDMRKGVSKYSLKAYLTHFISWRKALEAFIQWIGTEEMAIEPYEISPIIREQNSEQAIAKNNDNTSDVKHKTARNVNLRLRFLVMKRDNFKCCYCGASPAKDPSVELHIDHIKPWSKGGETTIDNLRTSCSKCNLGKSDLDV